MIELYHASISTCSQKVRLCLAEKEIEWVDRRIDFATQAHLQPEYLKLNPNGVVPTLIDDGQPVIDSSVICEYLEERFPNSGTRLSPSDVLGKAKMRAWLRYIEEVPTTAIRYSSFNRLFKEFLNKMGDEEFDDMSSSMPLRKGFYKQFRGEGFSTEQVEESIERLRQTIDRVDAATASGDYLLGDQASVADFCVLPTIVRMEDIGLKKVWQGKTHFSAWYQRMQQRSSFEKAYYDGARVSLDKSAL